LLEHGEDFQAAHEYAKDLAHEKITANDTFV